ncbi:hypothetical protein SAMN04488515_1893 [Cognatiyoonia koreensis]|uniref:Cell pole-organizing protein PopZ n=1 Tax=Cognatiyoonia koreensis TaxID=364200 RepID=A0A1I0QG34_9RHOB|nr:hypothetical protein [Cognatiyoonia koreensis]SEW25983.1 hypothetical protein SAMN04488515_1893 [Cognatiyoonia koreensis]
MSDPVTKVELEDILSSVKRLVSLGNKDRSANETVEKPEDSPSDKFVLTPALRVGGPDDTAESPASVAQEEDVWTTPVTDADLDDTTLILDMPAEDAESEATDTIAQKAETPAATLSDRISLEATIAELEAAVIAQPDEWEPDGSEVKTVPTWATVSYAAPAIDESVDVNPVEADAPEEEQATSPEPLAAVQAQAASPEPLILEDEQSVSPEPPAPEPETNTDEPAFGDTFSRIGVTFMHAPQSASASVEEDDTDVDHGDELAPDLPQTGADEDIDAYLFGDKGVVDEEALRQIVMRIVRDELQGKMGERITRNVRKMVRREIHRVITSQDFD